jgi:hypothetical protein
MEILILAKEWIDEHGGLDRAYRRICAWGMAQEGLRISADIGRKEASR